MSDRTDGGPPPGADDPAKVMEQLLERTQRIVADYAKETFESDGFMFPDPKVVGAAFLQWAAKAAENPDPLLKAQHKFWDGYGKLWQSTLTRLWGGEGTAPVIEPEKGDKRFKDDLWSDSPMHDFVKQAYLLASETTREAVDSYSGLPEAVEKKVRFYTRQWLAASSPTNYALTNPEVWRETMQSNGENLKKGFDNLLRDLERGKSYLKIAMTDEQAFEVGKNVATTPGKVVFQNELLQLIQYEPTTETAFKTPLLIVPPWINKFYVLDLQPKNSLIRWAVAQGHTVFVISWVNPSATHAHKTFEDYMEQGLLAALDAVEQATGETRPT